MSDPLQSTDILRVAVCNATALVCVRGQGSFKVAPTLKRFALSAIEKGCRLLLLDMGECVGMDSTFMGVIAGLATRLRDDDGGGLVVLNLTPKTMDLLKTLGLDRLVAAHEEGDLSPALKTRLSVLVEPSVLEVLDASKRLSLETMLEAHQNLVDLTSENRPRFLSVLDYLSEDLRHVTED